MALFPHMLNNYFDVSRNINYTKNRQHTDGFTLFSKIIQVFVHGNIRQFRLSRVQMLKSFDRWQCLQVLLPSSLEANHVFISCTIFIYSMPFLGHKKLYIFGLSLIVARDAVCSLLTMVDGTPNIKPFHKYYVFVISTEILPFRNCRLSIDTHPPCVSCY